MLLSSGRPRPRVGDHWEPDRRNGDVSIPFFPSFFFFALFFRCLTRVLLRLSVENVPGPVLVRVRGVVQLHRVDAVVLVPEPVLGPHGRAAAPGAATGSLPMRLRAP